MGRESRDRERLSGGIPLEFSESNTAVLAQVQIEHIGRVGLGVTRSKSAAVDRYSTLSVLLCPRRVDDPHPANYG